MTTAMMIKGWRQNLFLAIMLFGIYFPVFSQTIHYSRETLPLPAYSKLQLIPNVAGTYHLLLFNRNAPLTVCRFDRELQLLDTTELPVVVMDTCDMRVVPFRNSYLLYFHKRGSATHQLWSVNAEGEAIALSQPFQQLVDSSLKQHTSTLELVNREEQLVVVANIYYQESNALSTTLITVDKNLKPLSTYSFSYQFQYGPDQLNQQMLIGDCVYSLKASRHSNQYTLDLIKADLVTDKLFHKSFQSRENFTRDARFRYNPGDSSLLLQSSIGAEVFISKVDLALNERVPPTVLTPRYGNNVSTNFLLLDEDVQHWIVMDAPGARIRSHLTTTSRVQYLSRYANGSMLNNGWGGSDNIDYNLRLYGTPMPGYSNNDYYYRSVNPAPAAEPPTPALRFLVADKEFKLLQDSVITNKKSLTTVSATQYANISQGSKSYLVLKQDFPRKRKGLLLVSVDRTKKLSATDIAVYGKYEYLLQYAQALRDGSLVMPYMQGKGIGLVKLSFAGLEQE